MEKTNRTKSMQISFRISETDYDCILRRAEEAQMNLANYTRRACLQEHVIRVNKGPEIAKVATNLGSIVTALEAIDAPYTKELKGVCGQLWDILV